jgi:hypothetical protein
MEDAMEVRESTNYKAEFYRVFDDKRVRITKKGGRDYEMSEKAFKAAEGYVEDNLIDVYSESDIIDLTLFAENLEVNSRLEKGRIFVKLENVYLCEIVQKIKFESLLREILNNMQPEELKKKIDEICGGQNVSV